MVTRSTPNATHEEHFSPADRLSRNLNVAKWLRRGGYTCLLLAVIWTIIYSQRGGVLYRAGADQQLAEWLAFGRDVSTILLRFAAGLIGLGILIPVAERARHSKAKAMRKEP